MRRLYTGIAFALIFALVLLGAFIICIDIKDKQTAADQETSTAFEDNTSEDERVENTQIDDTASDSDRLVYAATIGASEAGSQYADKVGVDYDDLIMLARIMQLESGIDWPDNMCMAIGEVVLNRVASPEFPNTIREVLYQTDPMQYAPVWTSEWEVTVPDARFVELSLRLLQGERVIADGRVVFQALFTQGSGIAFSFYDETFGSTTYFCFTNNPELYAVG